MAPEPFASRTELTSAPLSIIMLLKAVGELPLTVLLVDPLKLTAPLPALNVPLLVQCPAISSVAPAPKTREPFGLIVILAQEGAGGPASTVTVVPPAIITSSVGPGTTPQLQVAGLFHAP